MPELRGTWPDSALENIAMSGAPTALWGAVVGTTPSLGARVALVLIVSIMAACGASDTAITGVSDVVASLTITVETEGPAPVPAGGGPIAVEVGDSLALSATATNAIGLAVSGVAATWSSSAPAVVDVDATGTAAALAPGQADVFATVDGVTATVRVVVASTPTVPPPTP